MAVTITNKFYDSLSSRWYDLSKIVFTSPNLDSPSNAGTRSHILPGQADLGLWYETVTTMYKVADSQFSTERNFYSTITGTLLADLNLDTIPNTASFSLFPIDFEDQLLLRSYSPQVVGFTEVLDVKTISLSPNVYIGQSATYYIVSTDTNTGSTGSTKYMNSGYGQTVINPIGKESIVYNSITWDPNTSSESTLPITLNYISSAIWKDYGWYVDVVPSYVSCYIIFSFQNPVNIYKLYVEAVKKIVFSSSASIQATAPFYSCNVATTESVKYAFFGNFIIQGSNDFINWTTLYTGSNTTATNVTCYFTSTGYYLYYRLNLVNTTGLNATTFDLTKYGVRAVKFYEYQYSYSEQSDGGKVYLYNFDEAYNSNIIAVKDVVTTSAYDPAVTVTGTTYNISGNISVITISGTPYYSSYYVFLNSDLYNSTYSLNSTVISGSATGSSGYFYSSGDFLSSELSSTECYFTIESGTGAYVINSKLYSVESEVLETTYYYTATKNYLFEAFVSGISLDNGLTYSVSGTVTRLYEESILYKDKQYEFTVDDVVLGSGTISAGSTFCFFNEAVLNLDTFLSPTNSIIFEITAGEAYNCRLTAWDDITHSTTLNKIISSDRVRIDAVAYRGSMGVLNTNYLQYPEMNYVFAPTHNRILKGNVVADNYKYYYGDFNLQYKAATNIYGDLLMFRPYFYNIDETITYGVHDFYITLSYSYT